MVSGEWIAKGGNLEGYGEYDQHGYSVSLSNDGNLLAIGAPGNNDNGGAVNTYIWNGSEWDWNVDGFKWNEEGYYPTDHQIGSSVVLSDDGSTIAAGDPYYESSDGTIPEDAGRVRTFVIPEYSQPLVIDAYVPDDVAGRIIKLEYSEELDSYDQNAPAEFSLKIDGSSRGIINARVDSSSPKELIIELQGRIGVSQSVTLSYADPAGDNLDGIQDIEGNDAPSFTNLMVTNNSLEDVTPPELDSASVAEDGEHILLTFNELVSLPSSIDPNSFVVEVSGQTRSGPDELITSSGITYDSDSMSGVDELTLVLNGVVGSNETIKVSYVAPGDGTGIQDLSGNLLSNVIDKPAANNSTRDIIPPVITSPTAVSVRENISTNHVFYTVKTAETTGITLAKNPD